MSSANAAASTAINTNQATTPSTANAAQIAEKRAEAKRELLSAWEAFKEGRANDVANDISALGEQIFGRAAWTRPLHMLGPVIPETREAQQLRREGGKTALIDAVLAFLRAEDEGSYEVVFELGKKVYGMAEWSITV
ncbi:hypothetical protein M409DRAFT_60405 [Zasmidium cellare ATCC 36951]|uniref:Uncharacterized protein n=1 Tax=Zasmidium cellare ATCC 36951 TaxID=1080233 RepID=A0A6A6BZ68_ZASCE|nr:uncharacterized protein M409DRAFT_60405 [Zasmidium cellare ATCC 36951]KAF2160005.1 hypothetical protein M409DRAFT_60405 [Zasmidium cellare ATCC 36951]